MDSPPTWTVSRCPTEPDWVTVAPLQPFRRSEDGGPVRWATTVRLALVADRLHVRFECDDDDPWGTYTRRDDPIFEEEAVELFLAPGEADPAFYFEFEISPLGTFLDATIANPGRSRRELVADFAWNCPGVRWRAAVTPESRGWTAALEVPLGPLAPAAVPRVWRANLHRIERPRRGEPEFSSWSPTLVSPPDFHRPQRFGSLLLLGD